MLLGEGFGVGFRWVVGGDVLWKTREKGKGGGEGGGVHARCIAKTSGFTRGVCKNRGFY